ncbi:hypothetical protein LSH36_379g01088 [Paralvinella palmiformis]|uniref:Uncharacterized protein n=1 Tax=Paralvinella palmiformis TaxID=53620 RepID=A0AAD9MZB7_9ANNE|nr:hypothetical protein LSH36_379g01088 [Paralvinella palmiformis]
MGGVHLLMSFVGSVGTLMVNIGLEEMIKSAFRGVAKMLTGKKFHENCRSLLMVTEELVRDILEQVDCHTDVMVLLEERASRSRTVKLCLDNLVTPTFIIMLFVRAEFKLSVNSQKDVSLMAEELQKDIITHKEEMPQRIRADNEDRAKLQARINIAIDPLDPHGHPVGVVNIATGRIATDNVKFHHEM